jgi:WD40 repeat protein
MPSFDLDLTDPAPAAVERAMAEAVEAANLRCRVGVMRLDLADYRRFATSEFPATPEGVALWVAEKGRVDTYPPTPRATLLGVAWYTTPTGRRLVRIVGRRVEPFAESSRNRFGPPWRRWPALCLLDPDHAILRTFPGGEPEVIVMCDCGVVGPPDKLGWMLGRCGPCHDHLEEHGAPLASGAGPPVLRTAGQLIQARFLPSGQMVAGVEWDGPRESSRIVIWDRRTGVCRIEQESTSRKTIAASTFASGAPLSDSYRILFVTESGSMIEPPRPPAGVTFAFEGPITTAMSYDGSAFRRDLTTSGDWEPCWPERRRGRDIIYFSLALAPDGSRAAAGRTECVVEVFDRSGGEGLTLQPNLPAEQLDRQRIYALAYSPDGKVLAAGAGRSGFVDDPSENWFGRGGGLYLYDAVKSAYLTGVPTPNDDIISLAFSPDGSLLFYGSTDCTIHALDTTTWTEVASLGGHIGGVNDLTFSPDGETLASAGGDGVVRLWPWRQLLERTTEKKRARKKR